MEHGHHRQDGVAGAYAQDICAHGHQGVQEVRPVGIEHALGIARCARGIAEPCRRILVKASPDAVLGGFLHQGLIAKGALDLMGHMVLAGEDDDVLDRRNLAADLVEDWQKGHVREEDLILRMVDDVDQLLGEQARVQGMADRANAHNAVPGFDMAGGVPGQGGDPVALHDAQGLQHIGDPLGALVHFAIGGADNGALHRSGDDLTVAMPGGGVVQDTIHGQRPVLHPALHLYRP